MELSDPLSNTSKETFIPGTQPPSEIVVYPPRCCRYGGNHFDRQRRGWLLWAWLSDAGGRPSVFLIMFLLQAALFFSWPRNGISRYWSLWLLSSLVATEAASAQCRHCYRLLRVKVCWLDLCNNANCMGFRGCPRPSLNRSHPWDYRDQIQVNRGASAKNSSESDTLSAFCRMRRIRA